MSFRLNELEQAIVLLLSDRIHCRWTDIKNDLPDRYKKYDGSGFDVVLSRSLNRLVEWNIIWKMPFGGSSQLSYWISPRGDALASNIKHGLSVVDIYRDKVLAFSAVLHRLRNDTVISCMGDSSLDYFLYFKELVMNLDYETLVNELRVVGMAIEGGRDPLDLLDFTDEAIDYLGEDEEAR